MSQITGQTTRGAAMRFEPLYNFLITDPITTVATPSGGDFVVTLTRGLWRVVIDGEWQYELTVPDDALLYPVEGLITKRNTPPAPSLAEMGVASVQWVEARLSTLRQYIHRQDEASSHWHVQHGLGKFPSVTVVDSAGTQVIPDVTYLNANALSIVFSAAFCGKAYCG